MEMAIWCGIQQYAETVAHGGIPFYGPNRSDGRTGNAGAEGATAPETLRPKDRRLNKTLERGVRARRRDNDLRRKDRGGIATCDRSCVKDAA